MSMILVMDANTGETKGLINYESDGLLYEQGHYDDLVCKIFITG